MEKIPIPVVKTEIRAEYLSARFACKNFRAAV